MQESSGTVLPGHKIPLLQFGLVTQALYLSQNITEGHLFHSKVPENKGSQNDVREEQPVGLLS